MSTPRLSGPSQPDAVPEGPSVPAAPPPCLNCGAPLAGPYCAACGQPAVDLAAPTWHVVREALADATDLDGRALRTARGLCAPGRLTAEFLRGRRAPYVGPLKLFFAAGAVLSTLWVTTRGVDARFYGFRADPAAAGTYIAVVVRGMLAGGGAVALAGWALARGRRRLLDEAVFALHLAAALALLTAATVALATVYKLAWGTVGRVPHGVPSLQYLLFAPACAAAVAYVAAATRRVHGGPWWAVGLRALLLAAVGAAAVTAVVLLGLPR